MMRPDDLAMLRAAQCHGGKPWPRSKLPEPVADDDRMHSRQRGDDLPTGYVMLPVCNEIFHYQLIFFHDIS